MAASMQKKGRFGCHGDDTLDKFLLNQVAKFIKYGQLGPLSCDLRVSQMDYEKITAPNTFPQNDQIFRVNMSHFSYSCKMRYPLNLVLENWEYLWFY